MKFKSIIFMGTPDFAVCSLNKIMKSKILIQLKKYRYFELGPLLICLPEPYPAPY